MQQPYKEAISADIFSYISKASQSLELECYVIGGFVLDFILERGTAKDIDIVAIVILLNTNAIRYSILSYNIT